jgi:DNA-binding winged helix-turn-helix (wHTH) protein
MPTRRQLLKDGGVVEIGSRALDVLIALVESAGDVVSHPELAAKAWPNTSVGEGSLRVTAAGLRKALGDGDDGVRSSPT